MGCVHSNTAADMARPNLFQRNLCLHHKMPASTAYTTLGELGKGAFGVVDKVEHIKTKQLFAMKTVTFASGSKRSEFEKEMDILRGLHHPSIVHMVETYEDDHHFYIIMELCTGGTLLDQVKEHGKEFDEDTVRVIVTKLASVIQYLHSRYICHRDLKLENILVESQELGGSIKLCDFGASTLFRMGVHMRKVLGSVVYMAPEVLEGNYTQACDLWSLGVITYMLLSNGCPFHGATEDELIEKIFEAKVVFEGPIWDAVSPEAKSLIKKLLNPDPAARYSATQMLNHPWVKSSYQPVPPEVYDEFVPQVREFCQYSPLQRAALVAYAFCMPSKQIRKHSDVYNELNVAHNGILTLQELQSAPALQRFALDMDKVYQALDQQHENGVNLLEFVAATLTPDDVADDETLRTAFRIFDRQHTGGITQQNLMALLGKHFDMTACDDMVKRADADKDGKIGLDDFFKLIKLPSKGSHGHRFSRSGSSSSSPPKARRSSSCDASGDKESRANLAESTDGLDQQRVSTTAKQTDATCAVQAEAVEFQSDGGVPATEQSPGEPTSVSLLEKKDIDPVSTTTTTELNQVEISVAEPTAPVTVASS